jgi:alpha-galactosidase
MYRCLLFCLIALGATLHTASAQTQIPHALAVQELGTLAPTPPMGWASWNHFFCDYNEDTIRAEADALVSTGMRDAGYKYVVIQECIAQKRDAQGDLIADSARFPSGMPALTAYIHKLGLKAGIYTDIGLHTCYPNPRYQGSYGHEEQDARTFAAWGMDFVEMDYCNRVPEHTGRWVYEKMAAALQAAGKAAGHPILFYLCSWGNEQPWEWAQSYAQMWRTDFDISLAKNHVEWPRLVGNFESNTAHAVFSAPESWNDADMLEIGNPGLSDTEAQAQFSMWAMSPSPLLAGADLTRMSAQARAIYTNREVIAIDQDTLGAGAELVSRTSPGVEIWQRPLGSRTGNDVAVMLLNASESPAPMHVSWQQLGLGMDARARNVWTHRKLPASPDYSQSVAAHSAVLLRVRGSRLWQKGIPFEAESPANPRLGNAHLLSCGECSQGYGMTLGGTYAGVSGDSGGILFRHIQAQTAGKYELHIHYVRNGLEDKLIQVAVNSGAPTQVRAIMRSWNTVTIPVQLHVGENSVSIVYTGALGFDLDKVGFSRSTAAQDRALPYGLQ